MILDSSSSPFDYEDQPSIEEQILRRRKNTDDEFIEELE